MPNRIGEAQLAAFKSDWIPKLRGFVEQTETVEAHVAKWRSEMKAMIDGVNVELSTFRAFKASYGFLDLLFMLLGSGIAFIVVIAHEERVQRSRKRRRSLVREAAGGRPRGQSIDRPD